MVAGRWIGAITVGAVALGAPARVAALGRQVPDLSQVTEAAAATRRFTPPSDGKLTSNQVKSYIAVRRRAMAPAAKSDVPPADANPLARVLASVTSEATAAADLGIDVDEYRWVSARIAETGPAAAGPGSDLINAINAALSRVDAPGLTAGSQTDRTGPADASAARIAFNRQLLDSFRSELDALGRMSQP